MQVPRDWHLSPLIQHSSIVQQQIAQEHSLNSECRDGTVMSPFLGKSNDPDGPRGVRRNG